MARLLLASSYLNKTQTPVCFRTPWDTGCGCEWRPQAKGLREPKFPRGGGRAIEPAALGTGRVDVNEAQSRPPGEGCGAGYFCQAATRDNECGQEIISEWSSGCGQEGWGQRRQTVTEHENVGAGEWRVTGWTDPPSPQAAVPLAPRTPSAHVRQLGRMNGPRPHSQEAHETSLPFVGPALEGQVSHLTAPLCACPHHPPQVRHPPE